MLNITLHMACVMISAVDSHDIWLFSKGVEYRRKTFIHTFSIKPCYFQKGT